MITSPLRVSPSENTHTCAHTHTHAHTLQRLKQPRGDVGSQVTPGPASGHWGWCSVDEEDTSCRQADAWLGQKQCRHPAPGMSRGRCPRARHQHLLLFAGSMPSPRSICPASGL